MQSRFAFVAAMLLAGTVMPAAAQDNPDANRSGRAGRTAPRDPCAGYVGTKLNSCRSQTKAAAASAGTPGVNAKDGKLFNDTAAAANAQLQAKDFAGAAATYEGALASSPNSALAHRFYAGLAIALRQQAVVTYNTGPQPVYPPPGATNDQIRAANAANAASQKQRIDATVPLLRRASDAAGKAAALAIAPANKDRGADESIAKELRENASLLYQLDHDAVLATPRASADLEAAALRKWLADNPTLAEALVAKYGIATAATVVAKDPASGLTLADEVMARAGADADAAIGYADLVAAKAPAGDARRAKALAGLTRVEASVTDGPRSAKVKQLKTKLAT